MNEQVFGDVIIKPEMRSVFNLIIHKLETKGWDCVVEDDADWGFIILADKRNKTGGVILRRVKPFYIEKEGDMKKAADLQEKLRKHLVEIHPYRIHWNRQKNKKVNLLSALFSMA